jgi:hypothetical protein
MESLRDRSYFEKKQGNDGSMSAMMRIALDRYIEKAKAASSLQ